VALMVIAEAGLPLGNYSPMEVKRSVVGFGRAEKEQVQMMVRSLLGLSAEISSKDASDAVAVAICHANHAATQAVIGRTMHQTKHRPGESGRGRRVPDVQVAHEVEGG
jgi:crossover junction endodeoxyribonuclease RuvC